MHHVDAMRNLDDEALALHHARPGHRAALALRLYRHLALFVADKLEHMQIEEAVNNTTLPQGVKPDGRPLRVMPSEDDTGLTDDDIGALVAFVRNPPPVAHGPAVIELPLPAQRLFASGKRGDGTPVRVMPFEALGRLNVTDGRALHAYLQSLQGGRSALR